MLHTDLLFAASLVFWMRTMHFQIDQHAVAGRAAFSTKQKHASRRQCMRNSDIVITLTSVWLAGRAVLCTKQKLSSQGTMYARQRHHDYVN
jgi:hypothetical protein